MAIILLFLYERETFRAIEVGFDMSEKREEEINNKALWVFRNSFPPHP